MSTALQTTNGNATALAAWEDEQRLDLLKRTIAKDCTAIEFELFTFRARQMGLDPFMGQITPVKRKGVMTIQVGIHGLRLIADRTGNYAPGQATTFEYDEQGNLQSATVYIKKYQHGAWHEFSETAYWDENVQTYKDQQSGKVSLMGLWAIRQRTMLAKCAEAAVLRRGFPADLSGVYIPEEMGQDGGNVIDVTPAPLPAPDPAPPQPLATEGQIYEIRALFTRNFIDEAEALDKANRGPLSEWTEAYASKVIASLQARTKQLDKAPVDPDTGEIVDTAPQPVQNVPEASKPPVKSKAKASAVTPAGGVREISDTDEPFATTEDELTASLNARVAARS